MRRRRSASWMLITFLDLITCGLGASVLLMLIAAMARPSDPAEPVDGTVCVQVLAAGDVASEVGLLYRAAGAADWRNVAADAQLVTTILRPANPARKRLLACAVFFDLPDGDYEFQPYLRDVLPDRLDDTSPVPPSGSASLGPPPLATDSAGECFVEFAVIGQNVRRVTDATAQLALRSPGQPGPVSLVAIRRHSAAGGGVTRSRVVDFASERMRKTPTRP
jgi:hypothetical protein